MTSAAAPAGPATQVKILCPQCKQPNLRRLDEMPRKRYCQHCGHDIVLNNDGPCYYITRVIKEGGQGAVYEAIDAQQHVYAVKEMLDRFLDPKEREEAIARFEAEAKMLQHLRHPRVPRVYADFKDEGRHYLVMDFVRGEDLEDILKRDGKVPEAQVLAWADQICDVLEALHGQDPPIIFRDMKPSNIMIDREGGVKLIDFGIAKVFQPTQRGTQIGTPGYAPPEQYQGIATVESDVYALGATLHHLLTGRDPRDHMPFTFPPVRTLNPAVSERTAAAVDQAVQKIASDRFNSVAALRVALRPAPRPAQQPAQQPAQPARPANRTVILPPAQQAPAQQPAMAARPATVAQPKAVSVPQQAPPVPAQQPAQQKPQQQKPARRFPWAGFVFGLIAVVLIGATLLLAFPSATGDLLPQIQQPTVTAQVLVQTPFSITDYELIVPAGQDVRQAYQQAFLAVAQSQYGAGTRINTNVPPAFVGQPEKLSEDSSGAKYRATMSGYVLVPK